MQEEWTIFGERLRTELQKQGIHYRPFAKRVGLTTTTVCRYAKSERIPRANEIITIADALGVTCDYMLGLSDDPHKTSKGERIMEKHGRLIDADLLKEHIDSQRGKVFTGYTFEELMKKFVDEQPTAIESEGGD